MGMFKDLHGMNKQAKAMRPPEHRGIGGSMRAMRDATAAGAQALNQFQASQARTAHLLQVGTPATAVVTTIAQTGALINNQPEVHLDLTVTMDGESYPAETTQVISLVAIPQVQPGATVQVKVDPQDHQQVLVC